MLLARGAGNRRLVCTILIINLASHYYYNKKQNFAFLKKGFVVYEGSEQNGETSFHVHASEEKWLNLYVSSDCFMN